MNPRCRPDRSRRHATSAEPAMHLVVDVRMVQELEVVVVVTANRSDFEPLVRTLRVEALYA